VALSALLATVLSSTASSSAATPVPRLTPAVVARAQIAPATLVRMTGNVTVARVSGLPSVFRVRVGGTFPARALRYRVMADGRPVAYGVPAPVERALLAVTTDRSVLTGRITVRYGDGRQGAPVSAPAASSVPTPSPRLATGPHAVTRAVYDLGNQAYQPPGLDGKVELTGDVHYPTDLANGPYPIVLFLHGNHETCYRGTDTAYRWPCPSGFQPLPNYTGYDYIAARLASYGFIVVSVSGNGVNVLGNQVDDTGMRQRGELLEKHLDLWHTWSTAGGGPFGSRFVGRVDFSRIGVMGHSRGGEGAVWQVIVDRARAAPYGIDAVLPLAPVDFTRVTVNRVPLEVMLPYCDGDVSDLQGMHFFDDARYKVVGDPAPKGTVTVMGANHNFFNTVWSPGGGYPGAFDDGSSACASRLTEQQQRTAGSLFITDYFRRYVGGTTSLDPEWTGAVKPTGLAPAQARVTYLPPDLPAQRLEIDRFGRSDTLTVDRLGGAVTTSGLTVKRWCPETFGMPCVGGSWTFTDVHLPGPHQGILGWAGPARINFGIPQAYADVHGYSAVQFRVAVNPAYRGNRGVAIQDMKVELADRSGNVADVAASQIDRAALEFQPGPLSLSHFILNQLRFPLSMFHGVDLRDISSVRFVFGATERGVVNVADLAFTRGAV
jgi:hypothetical protein